MSRARFPARTSGDGALHAVVNCQAITIAKHLWIVAKHGIMTRYKGIAVWRSLALAVKRGWIFNSSAAFRDGSNVREAGGGCFDLGVVVEEFLDGVPAAGGEGVACGLGDFAGELEAGR